MKSLLYRLLADEGGQDLVEYALLTSFVALVSVAGFDAIRSAISSAYGVWGTSVNNLWESPAPSGS